MNKPSKLAAEVAGALMVASLLGTSAFAESRHRDWTQQRQQSSNQQRSSAQRQSSNQQQQPQWRGRVQRDVQPGQTYERRGSQNENRSYRGDQSNTVQRSGRWNRSQAQVPQVIQPQQQRNDSRFNNRGTNRDNGTYSNRGYSRDNRGYGNGSYNRDNRGYSNPGYGNRGYSNRGYSNPGYSNPGYSNRSYSNRGYGSRGYGQYSYPSRNGRAGTVMEGRITRMNHERGGYRVWLDRGGYSYWVPEARFRLWPLRVGLSIRFGGWWNPLGYYDVYDAGPYNGPFYTSGDLHGVVESVDYYRGTVVLRDDLSGSFVTAVLRGGDPRLGSLRPGDYVDLSGAWTRGGYFDAYALQDIRQGGYGYGYDRDGDGGY